MEKNKPDFLPSVDTPIGVDRFTHKFHILTKMADLPVNKMHDCRHKAASIMLSHVIPPIIMAGMLGHSLSILMTTYAHYIPWPQDKAARLIGFAFHWRPRLLPYFVAIHILMNMPTIISFLNVEY